MNDIMEILKSLEENDLLIEGINEIIKNEAKEQKGWFLSMILSTLSATLLGNLSTSKITITAVEGTIKEGRDL